MRCEVIAAARVLLVNHVNADFVRGVESPQRGLSGVECLRSPLVLHGVRQLLCVVPVRQHMHDIFVIPHACSHKERGFFFSMGDLPHVVQKGGVARLDDLAVLLLHLGKLRGRPGAPHRTACAHHQELEPAPDHC